LLTIPLLLLLLLLGDRCHGRRIAEGGGVEARVSRIRTPQSFVGQVAEAIDLKRPLQLHQPLAASQEPALKRIPLLLQVTQRLSQWLGRLQRCNTIGGFLLCSPPLLT
jgi:hypothetical protein